MMETRIWSEINQACSGEIQWRSFYRNGKPVVYYDNYYESGVILAEYGVILTYFVLKRRNHIYWQL